VSFYLSLGISHTSFKKQCLILEKIGSEKLTVLFQKMGYVREETVYIQKQSPHPAKETVTPL
jgi:hypothetical protein